VSTRQWTFQLLRLILINSYSPGRVVAFPLDGGAVLTGRNGRGKTTLLQLLPIFYGENPARIVGTETNRLDFNAFYLLRRASYISCDRCSALGKIGLESWLSRRSRNGFRQSVVGIALGFRRRGLGLRVRGLESCGFRWDLRGSVFPSRSCPGQATM
jgi:hypothetical protein